MRSFSNKPSGCNSQGFSLIYALGIVDAVGEGVLLPEFEQVSNQQSVSQPIADR